MPIEPASRTAADDSPLGDTEVHHAISRHVDEVFKIFDGHCGTQRAGRPCALLCVTDANGFFGAAAVDMEPGSARALRRPALN